MEYVGVDVAKETLEVADVSGSRGRSFANRKAGIQEFLSWLPHAFPEGEVRLIMEPTSTYQHLPPSSGSCPGSPGSGLHLDQSGQYCGLLPGAREKGQNRSGRLGLLALTKRGQQPKPTPPPEEHQEGLKALRRHLVWLEKELQAARNRLDTASFSPWTPQEVLDSLERTIQQLEEEIKLVRAGMASQQEQNQEWTRQMELLTTIPGVGEQTARLLLTELPPVARCPSARTWAAFCGLNPEPRQSGKGHYSRLSRKGTARVRAGLYLPAVSALRWNPVVKALGERLRGRGQTGRVRIVAAMHKLLRLCFGVLKSGRPFDLSLHQATLNG